MPEKKQCPVCHKPVSVKKDGTLRHHLNTEVPRDGIWAPMCKGTGVEVR